MENTCRDRDFKPEHQNCYAYCARPKVEFVCLCAYFFFSAIKKKTEQTATPTERERENRIKESARELNF